MSLVRQQYSRCKHQTASKLVMDLDDSFDFEDLEPVSSKELTTFWEEIKKEVSVSNDNTTVIKEENQNGKKNMENIYSLLESNKGSSNKNLTKMSLDEKTIVSSLGKSSTGGNQAGLKAEIKDEIKKSGDVASVVDKALKMKKKSTECLIIGCNYKCNKKKNLREHMKINHGEKKTEKVINCTKCDYQTYLKSKLTAHERGKHNSIPFYCLKDDCDFESKHEGALNRHVRTKHLGQKIINPCECSYVDCEFKSDHRSALKRHVRTVHLGEKIINPCECTYADCGFKSNHRSAMKRHVRTMHLGEKFLNKTVRQNIPCTYEGCGFLGRDRQDTKRHIAVKHEIGELISCDLCKFTTHRKEYLTRHIIGKHDETTSFSCSYEYCDYKSNYVTGVNAHIKRVHLGEKKIVECEECDYKGPSKFIVALHFTAMHTNVRQKCPRDGCDYTCKWKTSINIHLKEKHGEGIKLYCSECGFQTYRKRFMVNHTNLVHLNIKEEYFCDQCVFKTSDHANLERHIKVDVHIGDQESQIKDICCSFPGCDYKGSTNKNLRKHVRRIHDEKTMVSSVNKKRRLASNKTLGSTTEDIINDIMQRKETYQYYLQCEYCEFVASSSNDLLLHNANWHKTKSAIEECKLLKLM